MANIRTLNKDKYKLSDYRFRELYYFCLQYHEWKQKLNDKRNPLKGMQYSGLPSSGGVSNLTEFRAIECAELSTKCAMVEKAAQAADSELYQYILFAVTRPNISFNYLKMQKKIPCERDRYYNSRRKFYFLLDKILIKNQRKENDE